jgi:hypothetical protein
MAACLAKQERTGSRLRRIQVLVSFQSPSIPDNILSIPIAPTAPGLRHRKKEPSFCNFVFTRITALLTELYRFNPFLFENYCEKLIFVLVRMLTESHVKDR